MNVNSIKFSSTREELVYVFDPNNPQKYRKQTHCSNNKLNNKKEIQIATECINNIKKLNEEEEIYEAISHCVHHLSGIFFQKFKSKTGNKLIEKIYEIFTKVKNIDPIMIIVPELYFGATKTIFIGKMAILSLIFAKYGKYGEAIRLICKIIENSNYNKETLKYLLWIYSWLVSNDRDEVIDSMLKEEEKTNFLTIFISKIAYIEKIIESHDEYLKNQNLSKKNIDDLSPINISCKEWKYMFSLFEILWSDRLIDSYSEKTWDTLSHVFPKCYRSPLYNNAERSREIAMRFCRLRNNFNNVLQYAIASREFGNIQESIELFTEASMLGHENSKDCYLDIADIYLQQKKYEDALIWYSKYPQNEKKFKWAFIHILHIKTILISNVMKNSFEQYLEMLKIFKQNLSASIDIIPQKRILQLIGEHVRLLQDAIDYLAKNNMVQLEFLYCNEIIFILMDYYPLGVTESLYKALQISQKNELIASQLKPVDRYNSRQLIALIYQRMKNYQLSLQSHNQSLEMASKIEDTHTRICAILQAMFNISTLHNITSHYPLALKNCNQALSLINMYIKKNHATNKDEPNFFNQVINQGTYYNNDRNNQNNNNTNNNYIHNNNINNNTNNNINNNNTNNGTNDNKIVELQTLLKVYFQFLHLASEIHFKHKQWEDVNKLTEEAIYGIPFTNEKNVKEFCSLSDFHLIFLMYGKSNFHLHQKETDEKNTDMTDESVFEHSESVEPNSSNNNNTNNTNNNTNVINLLKFRTLSDSQLSTKSSCESSQISVEMSHHGKVSSSEEFGHGGGFSSYRERRNGLFLGKTHLVRAKSVLEFSVSEKFESIFKGIESINNDEKPPNLFGLNSLQSNYLDYQLPQQNGENNVLTVCVNSISETKADICSVLVDCYKVDNQLPKMIYYQQICNFIDYKLGKFKELLEGLYNISIMYMESNELVRAQRSFRAAITLAQNVSIEHTGNILQRSLEYLGVIEKNLQNGSSFDNQKK